ncbi:hypothetical protein AB6A40_005374 [Gnathostoma spinigerum]|uniref:Peptidase M12B domain-containing protein n=1 Tax=Gnathostoma spinigerum TaxID=75299 RepID=A0ABD6EF90_9BILA
MCTQKAVLLCGFYPNNPEAMGSIFFHEVAHLVGVPHRNASDQLYIENCFCNNVIARNPSKPSRIGCLKIPGYDHDCTVQQMANRLHRNPCLDSAKQQKLISAEMIQKALPICGNGIVEGSEECDCGLEKFCWDPNCIPNECKRIVNEWVLYLALISIGVIMTILFATFMYRRFVRRYPQTARISMKFGPSITSRCFGFRHSYRNRKSNYTRSLRQTGIMIAQKGKINPASIVVLVDSPRRNIPLRRNSTKRPDHPPPPPPLRSSRTPYQSENLNDKSYVEQSSTVSKWHPPIPEKPRSLASAFHDNSALTHDEYEIPNSVRTRNSVLAVSVNEGHPTAYDSASRNFDDFDDDFEWESDDEMELDCSSHRQLDPIVEAPIPSSDVRISAQYTPVIPKDFRDDEEHMKMNEANAVSENSTGAPRQSDSVRNLGNFFGVTNDSRVNLASFLLRNHSMEFRSRLRNNDSFNSSDSFGEKRTASDDTVSTGLSEDDKSLQAQ